MGSYSKKRIFGQKSKIFGPKKSVHFMIDTMFKPRPGKVVQRKRYPQINISLIADLGCFFVEKWIFGPKSAFGKTKNGRFALIPAGTRFVVSVGHFFGGLDGPTMFC